MAIGIDPTVDFAFKMMVGNPKHPRVTVHFLNAILDGPRITQVEFRNPIVDKESNDDKLSVLDILAVDELRRILNIEVQTSLPAGMSQRLAYYVASLYVGQLGEGSPYTALHPAISICVLTKPLFPQSPKLHLDFRLRDSGGLLFNDNLQIHLLQLPYLQVEAKEIYNAPVIERWSYFLQNAGSMTTEQIAHLFPDSEFVEAAGALEMISQTPEQRMAYEARLKFQRDEAAKLEFAHDEGLREGQQEGLRKGKLIGQISTLQEILGVSLPSQDELLSFDEVQLLDSLRQLQSQFRQRGQ